MMDELEMGIQMLQLIQLSPFKRQTTDFRSQKSNHFFLLFIDRFKISDGLEIIETSLVVVLTMSKSKLLIWSNF